jgi:hypothetical protein
MPKAVIPCGDGSVASEGGRESFQNILYVIAYAWDMPIVLVDTSGLDKSETIDYLSKSRDNIIVISDMTIVEVAKGGAFSSLQNLYKYKEQIRVLYPLIDISWDNATAQNTPQRLINRSFNFGLFYENIVKATNCQKIKSLETKANKVIDSLDTAIIRKVLIIPGERFDPVNLKTIRRTGAPTRNMAIELTNGLVDLSYSLLSEKGLTVSSFENVYYSFIYRLLICQYAQTLDWTEKGGVHSLPKNQLKNGFVDIMIAACATLFDGFITNDNRLRGIYEKAKAILAEVVV